MKKTVVQENTVIKELQLCGSMTLKECMEKLNISEATARRLFSRIESKGQGIRSYGKIRLSDSEFNFYRYETAEEIFVEEKKEIAEKAVKYVESGDVLFIDSGSTVCLFCTYLKEHIKKNNIKNVKVFTNSFMIVNILGEVADVNMIGGTYRPNRKDFCGYMTEKTISEYHFTKGFLGTDGYSENVGFTTTDFDTARISENAIKNTAIPIILMDSHKFNKKASICFSKGDDVFMVITDKKISQSQTEILKRSGIKVEF